MNYNRFLQVAGDFEKGSFQNWCRNREFAPMEELFEDWWSKSYTARDLKRTEGQYNEYSDVIERPRVADLSGRWSKSAYIGMVECPKCGHDVRLLEG